MSAARCFLLVLGGPVLLVDLRDALGSLCEALGIAQELRALDTAAEATRADAVALADDLEVLDAEDYDPAAWRDFVVVRVGDGPARSGFRHRPATLREANASTLRHHRHAGRLPGHKASEALVLDVEAELPLEVEIGTAIVGRPTGPGLTEHFQRSRRDGARPARSSRASRRAGPSRARGSSGPPPGA